MIEDVKIINLKSHEDDRGFFREIFRFNEQFRNIPVGQLSHSEVNENVVKAWHGHVYQSQWNYVVSGQIKVALFDKRESSSTKNQIMEFIAGEDEQIAYFFPPGVFHGYKCLKGPMQIIYVTSGSYDTKDEIREDHHGYNF